MTDRDNPFDEIEQLVDQFAGFGTASDVPIDMVDADDELVVVADLPGRSPDGIAVRLEDDRRLVIEAGEPSADLRGRYVTRERSTASVGRTVTLPAAVDGDATEASYDRGVLTIRLGKLAADTQGTEIPVE